MTKFIILRKLCRDDAIELRLANASQILHIAPSANGKMCRIDFNGLQDYWKVDHTLEELAVLLGAEEP